MNKAKYGPACIDKKFELYKGHTVDLSNVGRFDIVHDIFDKDYISNCLSIYFYDHWNNFLFNYGWVATRNGSYDSGDYYTEASKKIDELRGLFQTKYTELRFENKDVYHVCPNSGQKQEIGKII